MAAVAGGNPVMRPDQVAAIPRSRAGSGPAPQQSVVVANKVIIIGAHGALLVYSPTAGPGNLVTSISGAAGTDAFGNAYPAGITDFGPGGQSLNIFGAGAEFLTGVTEQGVLSLFGLSGGSEILASQLFAGFGLIGPAGQGGVFLFPTGVTATDTANLAAITLSGFTPVLMPGTFNLNCGNADLTTLGVGQYIVCLGGESTIINAHGSGDLFYWSFAGAYSGSTTIGGGLLGYPMIDGSATTGNAKAIRAGDIESLRFQANVRHFHAGTASWGVLFDNQNFFTERMLVDLNVIDCGNTPGNGGHVGFNVGGTSLNSTSSFKGFSGRIRISQSEGTNQQDGLVLMNGARLYDSTRFELTGNFRAAGAATTAAAVRITGQVPAGHPDAGVFSQINTSHLVWTPECSAGANPPITVVFGTPGSNVISGCTGLINFSTQGGASFASAGNAAIEAFQFDGPAFGDPDLMRIINGGHQHYDQASLPAAGGTIITRTSGNVRVNQGALATGAILQQPIFTGEPSTQSLWVWNYAAAGSGFDIQFDVPGTSFVAGGTNVTIKAGFGKFFVWDWNQFLWFTNGG